MSSPFAAIDPLCCASVPATPARSDANVATGVVTPVPASLIVTGRASSATGPGGVHARRRRRRDVELDGADARAPVQRLAVRVDRDAGAARIAGDRAARTQRAGEGIGHRDVRVAREERLQVGEARRVERRTRACRRARRTRRSSLIDADAMRASTATSFAVVRVTRARAVPLTGVSAKRLPGASTSAAVTSHAGASVPCAVTVPSSTRGRQRRDDARRIEVRRARRHRERAGAVERDAARAGDLARAGARLQPVQRDAAVLRPTPANASATPRACVADVAAHDLPLLRHLAGDAAREPRRDERRLDAREIDAGEREVQRDGAVAHGKREVARRAAVAGDAAPRRPSSARTPPSHANCDASDGDRNPSGVERPGGGVGRGRACRRTRIPSGRAATFSASAVAGSASPNCARSTSRASTSADTSRRRRERRDERLRGDRGLAQFAVGVDGDAVERAARRRDPRGRRDTRRRRRTRACPRARTARWRPAARRRSACRSR